MKHIIYNNIQTKKEHRKRINTNFRANKTIKELYICRENASSATYMRERDYIIIIDLLDVCCRSSSSW